LSKQITGSASKPLAIKAGEQQVITIAKGQQLRIQELINGQMKDAGKVMSSRKGKDLQVKFLDGTELVVKDFFEVCQGDACSVTLGDSQLGSFTITADTPLGNQLPDGTHLLHYSLADSTSLMDLAAAGGEFIKTSTAAVAQVAAPAAIEGAAVAQAAALTGGSNLLWAAAEVAKRLLVQLGPYLLAGLPNHAAETAPGVAQCGHKQTWLLLAIGAGHQGRCDPQLKCSIHYFSTKKWYI
jgi:hypothetical protein